MPTITASSASTQFTTIDGDSIAFRSIGSGKPLLLANRLRGTLDTWDPLFLDALARDHTVISFDYPGVGYSSGVLPPDPGAVGRMVIALADALGLARFAMAGWSWGGMVAQVLVTDHPARLTHAIVIGANPPGANPVPVRQAFLDRALKPVNDLADEEVLFFVPDSERSMVAAMASHDRIYSRPGVVQRIPGRMAEFLAFFKVVDVFRDDVDGRRAALVRTRVPTLLLCGDHDISAAVENWFPLVGAFPRAQLIVLGDAGHAPQHEYPELAADYIRDFLRANPGERLA